MTPTHSLLGRTLQKIAIIVVLLFFLAPPLWFFATALKPAGLVFTQPPTWVFSPTLANFREMFETFEVLRLLRNSIIVTSGTVIVSLLLGVPAGYALARSGRRWTLSIAYFFLFVRMVPPVATLIPFYLLMRDIGLLGTYWALIIISATLNSGFVVWMMFSYFQNTPDEIEGAALVDGCTQWGAFRRVAVPIAMPGIMTSILFCVLFSWNDLIFALILTSPETQTLPVGLISTFASQDINWGQLSALSQVATLPIIVLALWLNKYFVQGLTQGSN